MPGFLSRVNAPVQAAAGWLAVLSAAYALITKAAPKLFGDLNWAESILVGIALALGTMLFAATAFAIGAYAFRLIRPLPASPLGKPLPELDYVSPALTAGDVEAAISCRIGELKQSATTVAEALGLADGRMADVAVSAFDRIDKLDAKVETMAKLTLERAQLQAERDKLIEERNKALEIDLGDVRRGCAKLEGTVEKSEKRVSQSLYAIQAREQLHQLASEIERDADDLYLRLKGGENYTKQDWDQWVNVEQHWERSVKRWVDDARWYAKDVKRLVLTVDDKEYDDGEWSVQDSQFPNADAVRRFKRHRIIHSHWLMTRDTVEAGLEKVAFQGGTEEEQHDGKYHQ